MTGRLVIRLGSVTLEAPLEPEALQALQAVFKALGLRLEMNGARLILSKTRETQPRLASR